MAYREDLLETEFIGVGEEDNGGGPTVGRADGTLDGALEGMTEGDAEGDAEGEVVGALVVGALVGALVTILSTGTGVDATGVLPFLGILVSLVGSLVFLAFFKNG